MSREFPRLWDTEFKFTNTVKIPDSVAGRMDLAAMDINGDPGLYFLLAAANGIRNPMPLRTTIRPVDESVRNELELRGTSDADLGSRLTSVLRELEVGAGDWLSYESVGSIGAITDVESGKLLLVPDMDSSVDFSNKYTGNE